MGRRAGKTTAHGCIENHTNGQRVADATRSHHAPESSPPLGISPAIWELLLKNPELARYFKQGMSAEDLIVAASGHGFTFRYMSRDKKHSLISVNSTPKFEAVSATPHTPKRAKAFSTLTVGKPASPMPKGGMALRDSKGQHKTKVVASMSVGDLTITFAEGQATEDEANMDFVPLATLAETVRKAQLYHKWFGFYSVHACRPSENGLMGESSKPKDWDKVPPVPAEPIKTQSVTLTKAVMDEWLLRSHTETHRSPEQIGVMRVSADDYVKAHGIHPGVKCEILHLVAYSFGGPDGKQPQVAENFVYGSAACNTWMMVCEDIARRLVAHDSCPDKKIETTVKAPLFTDTHIAKSIEYQIRWGSNLQHQITFKLDALCTEAPVACFADRIMLLIEAELRAGKTVDASFIQEHTRVSKPAPVLDPLQAPAAKTAAMARSGLLAASNNSCRSQARTSNSALDDVTCCELFAKV